VWPDARPLVPRHADRQGLGTSGSLAWHPVDVNQYDFTWVHGWQDEEVELATSRPTAVSSPLYCTSYAGIVNREMPLSHNSVLGSFVNKLLSLRVDTPQHTVTSHQDPPLPLTTHSVKCTVCLRRFVSSGSPPFWIFKNSNCPTFVRVWTVDATVVKCTFDVPLHLQLSKSMLHGQTYNRASNMAVVYNGCRVIIRPMQPLVLYIHCVAHCVNVVAEKESTSVITEHDAIDTVKELTVSECVGSEWQNST